MSGFRGLDQAELRGRRALLRLDLNVPVENGVVTDTTRIDRALPTLRALLDGGAAVLILAHFDRPKGKVVPAMSLAQLRPALEAALGRTVRFLATDWTASPGAQARPGEVVLLENTRFHPGEEKNDPELAKRMADEGDLYVNDAFSAAHRAHASTEAIARLLPAYAGLAMVAELDALAKALKTPKRPLVAIVGGAKVSTKLELLGNLSGIADTIVIGGGMANTFLAAQGIAVGRSLCEHDLGDTARRIMAEAAAKGCRLLLPVDAVTAREFKAGAAATVRALDAIGSDEMILDIGPRSLAAVKAALDDAATIVWNGPLGAFEVAPFDHATSEAARHAAALTKARRCVSVAGGGDTVAALNHAGAAQDFTYVSTAGGAFLEWLEGKPLPGVEALNV